MQSIYEKQISYKYLPLELASANTVKNSIAKNILFQSLGHGLLVIKFGKVMCGLCDFFYFSLTHVWCFRTTRWPKEEDFVLRFRRHQTVLVELYAERGAG